MRKKYNVAAAARKTKLKDARNSGGHGGKASTLETRSVTLPRYERSTKRIADNLVVQVGEAKRVVRVSVDSYETGSIRAVDDLHRELCLYLRGSRIPDPTPSNTLRVKSPITSLSQLASSTDLKWVSHYSATWPSDPASIAEAWRDSFRFVEEDAGAKKLGLRLPQIGALHAVAAHWTVSDEAATIVMPTGTGKTEAMLATLVYCRCPRVLVIVPTDALRTQTFHKFCVLGCLREIGAVRPDIPLPQVAFLRTGVKKADKAIELAKASNVLVATVSVLTSWSDTALAELAKQCTHLFVDEAHHLAARTWTRVKHLFAEKPTLQFTATPFRNDGKQIEGKLIYNYPLGKAQEAGYFRQIELLSVEELDDARADIAIANGALERLDSDLKQGLDHLVLARVRSIPRARDVLAIYETLGKQYRPVAVHSDSTLAESATATHQLETRHSRILVCVNMFGEGFDFPQLKVAAMHDIHKSLPITLQFVGRFVRDAANVGSASVVVNMADPQVDSELQSLYSENPDWNELLRRSSEERIARAISLQDFVRSFSGDLPRQLPLWNLRPGYSTVVYRTNVPTWSPKALLEVLPRNVDAWEATSEQERIAIAVIAKKEDVKWGRYQNIKDHFWTLVVVHWDKDLNLLFVYASDYKVVNTGEIARALCGQSASLVNGPQVFRVFSGIERPMVKNLGASKAGTISFTMYFGPEVSAGLSQVEKAESDLNNLFGWGYEGGERVTQGCSARRGKLWAVAGGPIMDWRSWCQGVGKKVNDTSVQDLEVIKGFLRPIEITERPSGIPVAAEWGERVLREEEDRVVVWIDDQEFRLHEVDLRIAEQTETGPIPIEITSEEKRARYKLRIDGGAHGHGRCCYERDGASRADVQVGRGTRMSLEDWCESDPIILFYADGSFSYNQYFVKAPCDAVFDSGLLTVRDWRGTNIKVESQGQERNAKSIQYAVIQDLLEEFDVVFDDDGSGEAADIIALRREGDGRVLVRLIHCKYSSEAAAGARVKDVYELCGQAQKCIKWKHVGVASLVGHMKRREQRWQAQQKTRFVKGTFSELRMLEKLARHSRLLCEIVAVQPGLAKSLVTDPILRVLGSTELYLKRTGDARFSLVCSE